MHAWIPAIKVIKKKWFKWSNKVHALKAGVFRLDNHSTKLKCLIEFPRCDRWLIATWFELIWECCGKKEPTADPRDYPVWKKKLLELMCINWKSKWEHFKYNFASRLNSVPKKKISLLSPSHTHHINNSQTAQPQQQTEWKKYELNEYK